MSSAHAWGGVGAQPRIPSSPLLSSLPPAIRPEGKNNRLFVFSISMASVAHWSLDVAADSQEELQDWVKKIREVAQTADARVRACAGPPAAGQPPLLGRGWRDTRAPQCGMLGVC